MTLPIAAAVFASLAALQMGYKGREKRAKMKFFRSFNPGALATFIYQFMFNSVLVMLFNPI